MTTYDASLFHWENGFGYASSLEVFGKSYFLPQSLMVKSPKTNKVLKFHVDRSEADRYEYWDGEFTILRNRKHKLALKISNF
jgi:hypothetical protein